MRHLLRIYAVALFSLCAAGMTAVADAHAVGLSWIATSTPYVIDIGYDPLEFQTGQAARFDFVLRNEKTGDVVPYDHVWVRLTHDKRTMLATGIAQQDIGPTTLLFGLTESGAYKIDASFRDSDGNDIAAASFPVPIRDGSSGPSSHIIAGVALTAGLIMGILGSFIFFRAKKRR